ncbi:tyrosine-type recombinase/integrase [Halomarina ordinaria]|uniref:Tyrosine-type recombinase/integrase n=1 Tax=Halomarina ordinaria TaxID=3033939 RepID=A0ABD5UGF5_9EURY|nr:site-specific integrase [Halomarina sp. PSRA2]
MTDVVHPDVDAQRAEVAAAFGRDLDPLAAYATTFEGMAVDPFDLFVSDVLDSKGLAPSTHKAYDWVFEQWSGYMAREGRHPACPNDKHVVGFLQYCRDDCGNQPDTVRTKLRRLNKAYEYWQDAPAFPHPQDYNPFTLVLSKVDLSRPPLKEPPRIPIETLGEILHGVTNVRDRAAIVLQFKLGLRASELCNITIRDISIQNADLQQHYRELGSHPALDSRPNAVYIPSRDERQGNKSRCPRVLPLDDEARHALLRYLLIRPDTEEGWIFLSKTSHSQLDQEYLNSCWIRTFRPEYAETEEHRGVTSHFGRHRFTTYWRVERDLNRELIKYMRGDTTQNSSLDDRGAIDDYIHTYYEDIEPLYREQIFKFGI